MASRLISRWMRPTRLFTNGIKRFPKTPICVSNRSITFDTYIEKKDARVNTVDVIFKAGLPFDVGHEFDYTWKPYLWSLQKVFHSVRTQLVFGGQLLNWQYEDVKNNPAFVLGCNNEVMPEFYDALKTPKSPVLIRCVLNDVGTTSYGLLHELRTLETNKLLSNLYMKVVTRHPETHRPHPHLLSESVPPVIGSKIPLMEALHKRGDCFTYKAKVLPSDIDFYDQVSYLTYLVHCSNCADVAFRGTTVNNFSGEFPHYKVKKVSSLYMAQSYVDEEIVVDMWEDDEKSDTLNFIVRKPGVDLFHCTVQLYV